MAYAPFQIHAFTHAAREQSFTKAALKLGVTQSSISQHIGKLEARIGTPLFVRRREGLELTRAGSVLFREADQLTDLEQLIEERILSIGKLDIGHLKIVATAPRPAMPLLADYAKRHPGVSIEFSLLNWTKCMEAIRQKEADLALITAPEQDELLVSRPVQTTRYVAYVNRENPLSKRRSISLAQMAQQSVVVPEDGSLTQRILAQKQEQHGLTFQRIIKTTTFPVMKEAVLHGVGIGLFLEDSHFPSKHLAAVPIIEMDETYEDCLVVLKSRQNFRIIESFLDLLAPFDWKN